MKHSSLLLPFLILFLHVNGQTSLPKVIAAGGFFYSSPSLSVSATIGEMSVIETAVTPSFIVTQGFQQPEIAGTWIDDPEGLVKGLHLYPNPLSGDRVQVSVLAGRNYSARIMIYDLSGRFILEQEITGMAGSDSREILLSGLENGVYLFRVFFIFSDGSSSDVKTILIKINDL